MYKVRSLMDLLNSKFQQWGIFHRELSIDESMVKYFGHHSSKQFIRGKPIRFGYKDWMLCSATGYCYKFDTYCGRTMNQPVTPLGTRVVTSLLDIVTDPSDHAVFFDNFFTSYELLCQLKERGFRATGTVRENRLKKCPLVSSKDMAKEPRGTYDYRFDVKSSVLAVRWKDNSIVTMASNYEGVHPVGSVKRWTKQDKAKVDIPQPNVFRSYNRGMGGVDLLDQMVNSCRISIRGKKWWWVLFTHMMNLAMVNAWRLFQLSNPNDDMELLDFQRNVTRHYIRSVQRSAAGQNRISGPASIPRSVNEDNIGHYPQRIEKQLRYSICHARVRWMCKKCGYTLCVERSCFEDFHTTKILNEAANIRYNTN